MDKFEILNVNEAAYSIVNRLGGPKADWSKRRGVSRVLKHSKIIGARKLTKNNMDHTNLNFRVFLVYETLEKIVWDTETWRGRHLKLICYFGPSGENGSSFRNTVWKILMGNPSPSRSKI